VSSRCKALRDLARRFAALAVASAASACLAQGSVDVLCSVSIGWCEAAAAAFLKDTGVNVSLTVKSGTEALAQLTAERASPKHDVWYGGGGHLRAAQLGLTDEYRSPAQGELHDWAVRAAEAASWHAVGIYAGVLGIAYNADVLAKKNLAEPHCWADLARPEYRDQIEMPNPTASDGGYLVIATLLQVFGEERAFELLTAMHRNVRAYARTAQGPARAAARGEAAIAVTYLHDAAAEAANGFPIRLVVPCEGSGYDPGAMSIVRGARHLDNARRFYDWALTPAAQRLGGDMKQFVLPSNRTTPVPAGVPKTADVNLIPLDLAKYADTAERSRLLERWERGVLASPR
jgi:iron(III) transport system substrate-binding protein